MSEEKQRKVCIITGANAGIGKETVVGLANEDFKIYLACRDVAKCEQAIKDIRARTSKGELECAHLELSSFASIHSFVEKFKEKKEPLHLLINNAGLFRPPLGRTTEGHELQFGVNHLGHFLLTNLLLDDIIKSAPSKIINVASVSHYTGRINFEDIDSYKSYDSGKAYDQSKLANVLFTYELHRRLVARAVNNVTVNALHPGLVDSDMVTKYIGPTLAWWLTPLRRLIMKTPAQGAETTLYLATSPEVEGVSSKYFDNKQEKRSSDASYDEKVAKRLWEVSQEMCGLKETI